MGTWRSAAALALASALGVACNRRTVEDTAMQPAAAAIQTPPGDVAIARYDAMGRPEFHVAFASGATRAIVTRTFGFAVEGGAIEPRQRTEWGVRTPAGARLFIAPSGRSLDEVQQMWVGWVDGAGLHAVSAYHEQPAVIGVPAGDLLALPPIVVASGKMEAFVFHAQGGGAALLRHTATGIVNTPIAVKTDTVLTAAGMPRLAAAACVSQVRDRDVAVVGWVDGGERACKVSVAVVSGATVANPVTFDIAGVRPVGGRLAVQMTPMFPLDQPRPKAVEVAFVGEQVERGGYAMVRAELDVKTGRFHLATTALALPAGPPGAPPLQAAYVWLPRDPQDERVGVYALRSDGVLFSWGDGALRGSRKGVPMDYAFPIEIDGLEPRLTAAGDVDLAAMKWE
jgi:hypothetical protein